MDLPDDEFVQEIVERMGEHLGTVTCTGQRFSYPLSLMHAKDYIAHRIALIGDAAHGIHPLAGQGVNLGFRDVGVLSELLIERFRLGLDIGAQDVLAHYQRWRRLDNVTMLAVTDNLNRIFGNSMLPVKIARTLGLWGVGQIPPLKRFFMKHAMGLVGDLPDIVKKNI
jgi:2-octaprenyl-6-methoxyphenol hydroxylase